MENVLFLFYLKPSRGEADLSCCVKCSSAGWKFSDGFFFSSSKICKISEKETPPFAGIPVQIHQVSETTFLTTFKPCLVFCWAGTSGGLLAALVMLCLAAALF